MYRINIFGIFCGAHFAVDCTIELAKSTFTKKAYIMNLFLYRPDPRNKEMENAALKKQNKKKALQLCFQTRLNRFEQVRTGAVSCFGTEPRNDRERPQPEPEPNPKNFQFDTLPVAQFNQNSSFSKDSFKLAEEIAQVFAF